VAAPWGDPVPHSFALVDTSFLGRLGPTWDRLGDQYTRHFAGGIVLLGGGLSAALLARRARARWAALAVALGFLLWATAPVSGVSDEMRLDGVIFSATRYLLPVLSAAALALALAATERTRAALAAAAILAAVTVVNLVQVFDLGFPLAPSVVTPLVGAAGGAVVAALLHRVRTPRPPAFATAALVVAAGALLALPASGFVSRHADTHPVFTERVTRWLAADPGFSSTRKTGVATSPAFNGPLAGDRLQHPLSSLASDASCSAIAARARDTWLVVGVVAVRGAVPARVSRCLGGKPPAFSGGGYSVYRPGAGR
jgi:hypothetical protein